MILLNYNHQIKTSNTIIQSGFVYKLQYVYWWQLPLTSTKAIGNNLKSVHPLITHHIQIKSKNKITNLLQTTYVWQNKQENKY